MRIKLTGLLFIIFNVLMVYLQFCPVWAKTNIILSILSYIMSFIAISLISETDKLFYSMGLGHLGYNSKFKNLTAITGLIILIEFISSIILGIYFLINL